MWDKLACIRSIVSVDEHSDSLVMTGYSERDNRTANHPSFGSVVSKLRGDGNGDMPPFVSLRGMSRRHRAGLPRHRAPAVHPERPRPAEPAPGQRRRRTTALDDRKALLDQLRQRPPRHRRQRHHDRHGLASPAAPSTWSPPAPSARPSTCRKEDRARPAIATRASSSS